MTPLGVGILGAGPVTTAIHLPTLAGLADRFRVVHVMDVDPAVGQRVAARVGARCSTDAAALLADPDVDVVAVCSPPQFHAAQVVAACAAGKRAVLCEKPLAPTAEDQRLIAEAASRTGVPVIVGAMHAYDPAYRAAAAAADVLRGRATVVRSTIYLPGNDVFIEQATDPVIGAVTSAPGPPLEPAAWAAETVRGATLGLISHHIPLIRRFAGPLSDVVRARAVAPWGYDILLAGAAGSVHLTAVMGGTWDPAWHFTAENAEVAVRVAFPPSYVLAGSATACVSDAAGVRCWRDPDNGYQAEWRHLADVVDGLAELQVPLAEVIDDVDVTLRLAATAAPLAAASHPVPA